MGNKRKPLNIKQWVLLYYTDIAIILLYLQLYYWFLFNFPSVCAISFKSFYKRPVLLVPVLFFVLCCSIDPISPHVVIKIVSKLPCLRLLEAGNILMRPDCSSWGHYVTTCAALCFQAHFISKCTTESFIYPLLTYFILNAASIIILHMKPDTCPEQTAFF